MPKSILILLCLSSVIINAKASSSFELMCRNQAKELAAETYKNCVTEQRQGQVEQIRNEYQQKLSDLKSHYDGELKKVSSGQSRKSTTNTPIEAKIHTSLTKPSVLKRASGARELPEKKVTSNTTKTEVIDFSKPTSNTETATTLDSTEIVEIPVE